MGYSRCGRDKYDPYSSYIVVARSKSLIRNQEERTNRTPKSVQIERRSEPQLL